MIEPTGRLSNRRVRVVVGLLIATPLVVACHQAVSNSATPAVSVHALAVATPRTIDPTLDEDVFDRQARRNPLSVFHEALQSYDRRVRDYTCTFVKQEKVNGTLRKAQNMRVKFREQPFSVMMEWVANADKAARVLYVKDKWTRKNGVQQAWVDPTGWAIDVLLGPKGGVLQDIHGAAAKKVSRRAVDDFGFANTLRLIITYCERAAARDALQLNYLGRSELNGRPTYLFERILPYEGPGGEYPDRRLLVHLDRENHFPIGVFSFSDDEKQDLLGSYVTKDVVLNPGLSDETFSKEANEF